MGNTKTGQEIVSNFISSLQNNKSLNQDVVKVLTTQYEQNKLSDKAIANELESLRKQYLK